jgi:hypothetical protein
MFKNEQISLLFQGLLFLHQGTLMAIEDLFETRVQGDKASIAGITPALFMLEHIEMLDQHTTLISQIVRGL